MLKLHNQMISNDYLKFGKQRHATKLDPMYPIHWLSIFCSLEHSRVGGGEFESEPAQLLATSCPGALHYWDVTRTGFLRVRIIWLSELPVHVAGCGSHSGKALWSRRKCALSQIVSHPDMTIDVVRTQNSNKQTAMLEYLLYLSNKIIEQT